MIVLTYVDLVTIIERTREALVRNGSNASAERLLEYLSFEVVNRAAEIERDNKGP